MRHLVLILPLLPLLACAPDPCAGEGALSTCLEPTMSEAHYVEQGNLYFNTMDTLQDRTVGPDYSELVVRWEWPPWLKLTAIGRDHIHQLDAALTLYPSSIPERDCRFFPEQPFARCRVVFYYEDELHAGRGCPIYEEFSFNDAGEVTWIEAWSDLDGFLPMDAGADEWAEGDGVTRLSTRIPGLGTPTGLIDLDGEAMKAARNTDPDVFDFVYRANNWAETWTAENEAAGDQMWITGCGWEQ